MPLNRTSYNVHIYLRYIIREVTDKDYCPAHKKLSIWLCPGTVSQYEKNVPDLLTKEKSAEKRNKLDEKNVGIEEYSESKFFLACNHPYV
jgi:hypothetical protein